jgi:hypothetical protein
MLVQHSAKPRLIGGRLLRFAWTVTGLLPKPLRRGNALGKWRSKVSEWAWFHHRSCFCYGCNRFRYTDGQARLAMEIAHKGYLHAQGYLTADEMKAAYNAAFGYGD